MRTLIRNGRVAVDGRIRVADVLVDGDRIAGVGRLGAPAPDRVLDAAGCYVLPGFIDFHTHVDDRIGRWYLADTYESGTRAALLNGITTLCTFVTQERDEPLVAAMERARAKAEGRSHCDVLWHLTPVTYGAGDYRTLEALVAGGYKTIKLYTTYKGAGIYASYELIAELFRRLGPLGARFMIHCEDDEVIAGVDASGLDLSRPATHGLLRPEAAEVKAIQNVVSLALAHRAALHVVHVSTAEGAEVLRRSRPLGDITFETCPQYLFLDAGCLAREDGHRWLCSPPLRASNEALRRLVVDGAADMMATDHCAFRPQDKDDWDRKDLRTAANGLPGVGTLAHATWRLWADDPDRAALEMARMLAENPARRAGLQDRKGALRPGLDADVVVLDPAGPERPVQSTLVPAFEAFPGLTTRLSFRHVLLRGESRVDDGRLLEPDRPLGVPLQPAPSTLTLS